MFKIQSVIAIAILSSGCASKYVEPDSGARAKLTLPQLEGRKFYLTEGGFQGGGGIQIGVRNEDGCGKISSDLNTPPEQTQAPLTITAEKGVFLHLHQTIKTGRADFQPYCSISGLFYPEKDKAYVLKYESESMQCALELFEIKQDGIKSKVLIKPAYVSTTDGITVCDTASKL